MIHCIQEYLPFAESIFVIIGVAFIVVQIRQQTKIARADHDRQKKQSTIEFYNQLSSESIQFLDNIIGRTLDLSSVNADKALRKSVVRYLSRLERLSIGVASEVYDFEILYLMSGRYLIKKYEQLESYIMESRDFKNAPTLYKEFELLVKKFIKLRKTHPDHTVNKKAIVRQP